MVLAAGLAALLIAAAPDPSPARPAVVVFPFEGVDRAIGDLSYAAALRGLSVLESGTDFHVLHLKQLLRVLEHHERQLDPIPPRERTKRVAAWLGASWVVTGTMWTSPGKFAATVTVTDASGKRTATRKADGADLLGTLNEVPQLLLAALEQAGAIPPAKSPRPELAAALAGPTESLEAMIEYASCYAALIKQPIGIREPVLLEPHVVDEAIERCEASIRADPTFADPHAALGLAFAFKGEREKAERELALARTSPAFLPLYAIAKFWVLSRWYGGDKAVGYLYETTREHPGFLIGRGYLGDALNAVGKHPDALLVFEDYLRAVPNQPWVISRIGYTQARLGDHAAALETTRRALRVAPDDTEVMLELASRLVDSGKAGEAQAILRRVIADGGARGEVHLRLGWVYLEMNRFPDSERELKTALEKASAPSEWRTRGRARYDLAKLWMRMEVPDIALRQIGLAVREGYAERARFEADPDLKILAQDPRWKEMFKAPVNRAQMLPQWISPFELDERAGEPSPIARATPAGAAVNF